jgi:hypothetical protein
MCAPNPAHVHGYCWNHCGYDERGSDPAGYWARIDSGVLAEPKCRFCGREFASRAKLTKHLDRASCQENADHVHSISGGFCLKKCGYDERIS